MTSNKNNAYQQQQGEDPIYGPPASGGTPAVFYCVKRTPSGGRRQRKGNGWGERGKTSISNRKTRTSPDSKFLEGKKMKR